MKQLFITLALFLSAQFASASPLYDAMHDQNKRRICPSTDTPVETRLLQGDVAAILSVIGLAPDSFSVVVADCGNLATTVMTLNAVVVSPKLATFPREERLFVIAHELGHIANKDARQWALLGDRLVTSGADEKTYLSSITKLSLGVELRADEFAARALVMLGLDPRASATAAFKRMHVMDEPDNSSHPATKRRLDLIAQFIL